MKTVLRALVLALLAISPAMTPATWAQANLMPALAGCAKPAAPVFPAAAGASSLRPEEMSQHRAVRDAYIIAADRNLACLDADIEARMRTLFSTGAPMDATLRAEGLAHEQASRERADVHERFLRVCLAYQDANGAAAIAC